MRKLFKLPIVIGLLAVSMLAATSSAGAAQTSAQIVLGSGSDTTWVMMGALDSLYNQSPGCVSTGGQLDGTCAASGNPPVADTENYFHDTIAERFWIGSGGGLNQVCKDGLAGVNHTDFARSSRVPVSTDCTGLHFVGYARDAITWECFPGATGSGCTSLVSGTNSLTVTQLKNIFVNCSVTNWNQIGGVNKPIHVYVPQGNSGTGVTWAAALGVTLAANQPLNNCTADAAHVIGENSNAGVAAVGDQANAIVPFSVGVYQKTFGGLTGSDGSSLGNIGGKKPTFALIQKGTFPVSRLLFNVSCQAGGSNKCGTAPTAPSWVLNYAGEDGFLCKGENAHKNSGGNPILDPQTGKAYRTAPNSKGQPTGEIPDTIKAQGFVPLLKQSDNTYCVTVTT
jgi:hypothetical protein